MVGGPTIQNQCMAKAYEACLHPHIPSEAELLIGDIFFWGYFTVVLFGILFCIWYSNKD